MENVKIGEQIIPPQFKVESTSIEKTNENLHNSDDTRNQFSDKELKEFKDLILVKMENAKKNFDFLKNILSLRDDNGTNDTSPSFKVLEDGGDILSKEESSQLAIREQKYIQHLYNALIRIENKTYGICRISGKLIAKERLKIVPHATMSIQAKNERVEF